MKEIKTDSLTQQDIYCKKCGKQIAIIIGDKNKIILKGEFYSHNTSGGICTECEEAQNAKTI